MDPLLSTRELVAEVDATADVTALEILAMPAAELTADEMAEACEAIDEGPSPIAEDNTPAIEEAAEATAEDAWEHVGLVLMVTPAVLHRLCAKLIVAVQCQLL